MGVVLVEMRCIKAFFKRKKESVRAIFKMTPNNPHLLEFTCLRSAISHHTRVGLCDQQNVGEG